MDVYGKYEGGTYYPHHYIIHGCFKLKDWIRGDNNHKWPQQPFYESTLIYPKDRILAINTNNIEAIHPMVDSQCPYDFGTCFAEEG